MLDRRDFIDLDEIGILVIAVSEHLVQPPEPGGVSALPQVQPEEPQEQAGEAEEQHHADPGMNRPGDLSAAEQSGQKEQPRMKQRQPGQGEQHEACRRDPMVDASTDRVAVDDYRIARMDAVAWLDIVWHGHDQLPANRLAFSSSSGATLLAPATRWCSSRWCGTAMARGVPVLPLVSWM